MNESVISSESESSVNLILDNVEGLSDSLKKQITEEFDTIVSMLNFNDLGHDMFRRWYVDGRIYHHLVVDEKNLKAGIQEIRPIDSSKIRKVKEVKKKKDVVTGASLVDSVNEFYIYQEKPGSQTSGVKLSNDSVSYVTSGLLDATRKRVVSHLHKALKPINQLRMMEDSLVIYRLARAPERRIFYIDVGNLPRGKAETYMKDIMAKYRNKLVYDAKTGEIRDDRKHMSMLEDFYLPRREGGRGTEITTLGGGENLGQIEDVQFFQKKLYRALNVPVERLEQDNQFNIGKSSDITRQEVKFQKFIARIRKQFSTILIDALRVQLILKGVITETDWHDIEEQITINFLEDNYFAEQKEFEIMRDRLEMAAQMEDLVEKKFVSRSYVRKTILKQNDEEIERLDQEIEDEAEEGNDDDDLGLGL